MCTPDNPRTFDSTHALPKNVCKPAFKMSLAIKNPNLGTSPADEGLWSQKPESRRDAWVGSGLDFASCLPRTPNQDGIVVEGSMYAKSWVVHRRPSRDTQVTVRVFAFFSPQVLAAAKSPKDKPDFLTDSLTRLGASVVCKAG